MAISSGVAACPALNLNLSNSTTSTPPIRNVSAPLKRTKWGKDVTMLFAAATAARGGLGSLGGGAGLLERPTFDQSQFDPLPEALEGGDIGRLADRKRLGRGDSYKVLLIDDPRHTEKLVENVLPQVVPSITAEGARKLFHESRQMGAALVIVTVKEHAEFYAQMMARRALRSAIEPDSDLEV